MSEPSAQKSPITLHWLEKSRSHRILWLLEELQIPYDLKTYKRDSKTFLADPALTKVHPLGKSPVIEDNGKVIAESGLIVEYLIDKYGPFLQPDSDDNKLKVKYFLHYAEGSLQPVVFLLYLSQRVRSAPMPFFIRPIARLLMDGQDKAYAGPDAQKQLEFLENELKTTGTGFFVGDQLSGADIILLFPLELAQVRAGLVKDKYPLLIDWLNRMHDREAFKRATSKVEISKL
ncbi:glutathione S-transferase [Lipomyces japonicus]|uniref:glutathione S-transferase n=1 Tax=Lipomyces japonicus TaxID=56871 RepID=UPI0034CEB740